MQREIANSALIYLSASFSRSKRKEEEPRDWPIGNQNQEILVKPGKSKQPKQQYAVYLNFIGALNIYSPAIELIDLMQCFHYLQLSLNWSEKASDVIQKNVMKLHIKDAIFFFQYYVAIFKISVVFVSA